MTRCHATTRVRFEDGPEKVERLEQLSFRMKYKLGSCDRLFSCDRYNLVVSSKILQNRPNIGIWILESRKLVDQPLKLVACIGNHTKTCLLIKNTRK